MELSALQFFFTAIRFNSV
jgi:hypothetical protein